MAHPFAKVEHLTDWYTIGNVEGSHRVIICRDLNSRQYAYRILCVVEGLPDPPLEIKAHAEELLMGVTLAHIANGHVFVGVDTVHGTITDHWHRQACFAE